MYDWTLSRMLVKIRKDCDLESDKQMKDWQITEMINEAIRDAESLIMNEFAGHYETFKDYDVLAGNTFLPVPTDLYQTRIKFIQYSDDDPDLNQVEGDRYQVKRIQLERLSEINSEDAYRYRIANDRTNGLRINLYPSIRIDKNKCFRVYYIRQVRQLIELTDICDIPNVNYILSKVKVPIMSREGHPMLDAEIAALTTEKENLIKTMTYLTDDGEDTVLGPNKESLENYSDFAL
jgi:hypothetical protein